MKKFFLRLLDLLVAPFTLVASSWFRLTKYWGIKNLPFTKRIFMKIGVFPIVDHYYEPLFRFDRLDEEQWISKVHFDLHESDQLELLQQLSAHNNQLKNINKVKTDGSQFYLRNGSFVGLDAYFLKAFLLEKKPSRIIEIGSGNSTRLIIETIRNLKSEITLTCIEPYEVPDLDHQGISVIRKRAEEIDIDFYRDLEAGDILFIDSSHVIRPQGDVLFEILGILPVLKKGVYVHIHDIFIPFDYPVRWMKEEFRLWNEQYLLQAFLTSNEQYRVIFSSHYLSKRFKDDIKGYFPFMENQDIGGCSFWIQKIS